ncbi:hypothetical protein GcC1_079025, partial [Golovinomyces cichoracearum]
MVKTITNFINQITIPQTLKENQEAAGYVENLVVDHGSTLKANKKQKKPNSERKICPNFKLTH